MIERDTDQATSVSGNLSPLRPDDSAALRRGSTGTGGTRPVGTYERSGYKR